MSELTELSIDGFTPPAPPESGPAPQLQWIKLALLRVDRAYQRDILRNGQRQIARIAAAFDWACFAPVIVAPIEGGLYAIIDGQHRSTGALLAGKQEVPCQIVIADARKQAIAFSAINGAVTRMSALATFRAALAGGEPEAVEIDRLAREAGIRVLGYPLAAAQMKRGDCTCPQELRSLFRRFGPADLLRAFVALSASGGEIRGYVSPPVLRGLCALFAAKPLGIDVIRVFFRRVDFPSVVTEAKRRDGFSLADEIRAVLAEKMVQAARRAS
ncbi:ParB/RepB/Spo0J family partition protein [Rhodoblastus sp. 17X3]|uniref:ParB/RepB/Spo0J family partition protein n=1 Tax=Rhodoblastus sp. 17X3 TaxID=3047026 RepID=UPI0024B763B5|nr:ParB/RepB/Spo0J family partition protein [Rhodoblastus sp. 17X3]MDI9847347.1 ParB/RepB/Spo0J family partition protein [Rhodoblastus sp. 17X3]